MKYLKRFAMILTSLLIISVISILFTEYTGLKQAQLDMACYMDLASSYAMSAVQDNTSVTNSGMFNDYSDTTQYNQQEYSNYLSILSGEPTDSYLGIAYQTLEKSYTDAISELHHNESLDDKLKYKPLSFNLPYVSISQVTQQYEQALEKIIEANGGASGTRIVLTDYTSFNGSAMGYYSQFCNKLGYNVSLTSVNGSNGRVAVSLMGNTSLGVYKNSLVESVLTIEQLNSSTIRKLYGDEDTFNSILSKLADSMSSKYKDIRFMSYNSGEGTTIPSYTLKFHTSWYYVTNNTFLKIPYKDETVAYYTDDTSQNLTGSGFGWNDNTDGDAVYVDDINAEDVFNSGVRAYIGSLHRADYGTNRGIIDSTGNNNQNVIRDGQLMLAMFDTSDRIANGVTKSYTLIG